MEASKIALGVGIAAGIFVAYRSRTSEQAKHADDEEVVIALRALQDTLHLLTPAQQSLVRKEHPFATGEWLDGLALAMRSKELSDGSSASTGAMISPGRRSWSLGSALDARETETETANEARIRLTPDSGKLILVLVGLPARGKSLLGYKLERFLSWRGYKTKAFQVGAKRRHVWAGSASERVSASFFDSSKAYAAMMREQVSMDSFDELLAWMENDDGQVAVSKRARKRNPCQPPAHDSPLMMCTAWSRVFALTPHQR